MKHWIAVAIFSLTTGIASAQYKPGTSFDGRQGGDLEVCPASGNFMSDQDVTRLVTEMLGRISARNRYIIVACPQVDNCQAVLFKGKPYILFNPQFLSSVRRLNFTTSDLPSDIGERDWEVLTVLAHELGHHINNHLLNPLPDATQRDMELEADEFAGSMIYRMGGTLPQATQAMAKLPEGGTYTHPGRQQRIQSVTKGWNEARSMYRQNEPGPVKPVSPVVPAVDSDALLKEGKRLYQQSDFKGAFDAFSRPELSQNAQALNYIGTMYFRGEHVSKDMDRSASFFRRSAALGYSYGQANLGYMYANGLGVSQDNAEALRLYRLAASQGSDLAMNNIGSHYQYGLGVEKSFSEAALWYRKAAELGHAKAQYNIGLLSADGLGVPKDLKVASFWFRKSADQGNAEAQAYLGYMHDNGLGFTQNHTEAAAWYLKAADQGNAWAQNSLAILYETGKGIAQSHDEAAVLYRKSADQGNQYAQHNLGRMCEYGLGMPVNLTNAKYWYGLAAAQGHEASIEALKRLK